MRRNARSTPRDRTARVSVKPGRVNISVDRNDRTVQLRAADGRTGNVYVDEAIFDVSTLKAGDKIRVDFVVPDATNNGLRAASVWRER